MRSDVTLSTRFSTTQNAHQVGLLVTLSGTAPVARPPINVALVLDRSGSMSGPALAAAKDAACRFASFLGPADIVSVISFDDNVQLNYGPGPGGDPEVERSIRGIVSGGMTNFSGGWLKGRKLVKSKLCEGTNRVVMLTDGMANVGVTNPDRLSGMAHSAAAQRISTTCIGFGAHFNEDLLEVMARNAGGNYWFIETVEQMADILSSEIEGLVTLAAQNLEVRIELTHAAAQGVTFLQSLPVASANGGWEIQLGDLYATEPRSIGLRFHVEDVSALGAVEVGRVIVSADVVTDGGIVHRVTTMPVVANLDKADHVEPAVEETFVRFETARAREEAVRLADQGDRDGAAARLDCAVFACEDYTGQPGWAEESADLVAEATRLREGEYSGMDRKYLAARANAARTGRTGYGERIRRK